MPQAPDREPGTPNPEPQALNPIAEPSAAAGGIPEIQAYLNGKLLKQCFNDSAEMDPGQEAGAKSIYG